MPSSTRQRQKEINLEQSITGTNPWSPFAFRVTAVPPDKEYRHHRLLYGGIYYSVEIYLEGLGPHARFCTGSHLVHSVYNTVNLSDWGNHRGGGLNLRGGEALIMGRTP